MYYNLIDGCIIQISLRYNLNTENIQISSVYRYDRKEYHEEYRKNHTLVQFLGKPIQMNLPKVKPGYHYHHVIYDHLNKDKYVVMMTRGNHTGLHNYMRSGKIEIQHINVRINDIHGF